MVSRMNVLEFVQNHTRKQHLTLNHLLKMSIGEEMAVVSLNVADFTARNHEQSYTVDNFWRHQTPLFLVRSPELGFFKNPVTNTMYPLELEYDAGFFHVMSSDGTVQLKNDESHMDVDAIRRCGRKHWTKYSPTKTRIAHVCSVCVPQSYLLTDETQQSLFWSIPDSMSV